MIYLFINYQSQFIFSYLESSNFFLNADFYGSYQEFPWKYRINALLEFLISYKFQNLFISFILLSCLYYSFKFKSDKNNYYWMIFWMVFSMFILYVFISPHGFTWRYFGSFMPLVAILCHPVLLMIYNFRKKIISIFLGSALMISISYGSMRIVKSGFSKTETNNEIRYLNELRNKIISLDIDNKKVFY